MENLLIYRIHTRPNISGLYSQFFVDVQGDDGNVYRGYVYGAVENGLLVRIGSIQKEQLVPFERIRLIDRKSADPFGDCGDDSICPEVDVLISTCSKQPESWQPARMNNWKEFDNRYHLVNLDVFLSDGVTARYAVIHRMYSEEMQLLRKRNNLGPTVTDKMYRNFTIPASTSSFWDTRARLAHWKMAHTETGFRSFWLLQTGTMIVDFHDNEVEVFALTCQVPVFTELVEQGTIFTDAMTFLESCDEKLNNQLSELMQDLVVAVMEQSDRKQDDLRIYDLPLDVHLTVCSHLDVYNQGSLKRVSSFFHKILTSPVIQSSVILPRNSNCVAAMLESLQLTTVIISLAQLVARSVTKIIKVVYLTGNWRNCLLFLTDLLAMVEIKPDWLIIANNRKLQFNDFFQFPKGGFSHIIVTPDDAPTLAGRNILPAPVYGNMCHNLLLKNCSFNSHKSICFGTGIQNHFVSWPLELRCCTDPFIIRVPCWHFTFSRSTENFATAIEAMLIEFCEPLNEEKMKCLSGWLGSLCAEDEKFFWPFVILSFGMWNVDPPEDVEHLRQMVSGTISRRSLLLLTIALMVPV
ncbi:uncharacterized protein LOC129601503 [Paramacrobiotus metropolitanus]|uniref:uncharacterized protein LOC129601503 n=1 Tax=Paramacrobiotus metropolitanus TaxID=2943436 RepID=UPI0024459360|nr:uncharacterized protein LOC129601503 [Paramacrobiotus metropolitanus]